MTSKEMQKLVLDQDLKFRRAAQRVLDKSEYVPSLRQAASTMARFVNSEWSQFAAGILTRQDWDDWTNTENDILAHVNQVLYPHARASGFPDSSFLMPDIELEDREVVGRDRLTDALGFGLGLAAIAVPELDRAFEVANKANQVVAKAKAGSPKAKQAIIDVKELADAGHPAAQATVETMKVISKAQDIKAAKADASEEQGGDSFYDQGLGGHRKHRRLGLFVTIGHDPLTFIGEANRRQVPGGYITPPGTTVQQVKRGTYRSQAKKRQTYRDASGVRLRADSMSQLNPWYQGTGQGQGLAEALARRDYRPTFAQMAEYGKQAPGGGSFDETTLPTPPMDPGYPGGGAPGYGEGPGDYDYGDYSYEDFDPYAAYGYDPYAAYSYDPYGLDPGVYADEGYPYVGAGGAIGPGGMVWVPDDSGGHWERARANPARTPPGALTPQGLPVNPPRLPPFPAPGYNPGPLPPMFPMPQPRPFGQQVWDEATQSFYTDTARQAYDPDTNTFYPEAPDPYYGINPFVAGWAYNRPHRSYADAVANVDKSPGVMLAARELYNRGLGRGPTTKTDLARSFLRRVGL